MVSQTSPTGRAMASRYPARARVDVGLPADPEGEHLRGADRGQQSPPSSSLRKEQGEDGRHQPDHA